MSLLLSSRVRAKFEARYACGRLSHFCPQRPQLENISGFTRELPIGWLGFDASSAASRSAAPGWWPAWMAAGTGHRLRNAVASKTLAALVTEW